MSDYLWQPAIMFHRCLWLYLDDIGEVNQCTRTAQWFRPGLVHKNVYVCNYHKAEDDLKQLQQELEPPESGVPA